MTRKLLSYAANEFDHLTITNSCLLWIYMTNYHLTSRDGPGYRESQMSVIQIPAISFYIICGVP